MTYRTSYLESGNSSPSPSLGGEALISKSRLFEPKGHRLLPTPLLTHSPHTHSSSIPACRPGIPTQTRWKPRSHPSQTKTCAPTSGAPHTAHTDPHPSPGSPAAAPAAGDSSPWKLRTTAYASGTSCEASTKDEEGISLRSIPSTERVSDFESRCSPLESPSPIIRAAIRSPILPFSDASFRAPIKKP